MGGVVRTFVTKTRRSLDPVVTASQMMRPGGIYARLESPDKLVRSRALQAYAIHIMRLLGLRLREWRKRAQETPGGAAVDALFTGVFGVTPTLWQVRCKITRGARLDLEEVSKEVGFLPITHASHILIITNGVFTKEAEAYATRVMRGSPVTIFLLGEAAFHVIKANPRSLGAILREMGEQIIQGRAEPSVWSRGR